MNTWLSLHASLATQRGYRKEAERPLIWAVGARTSAVLTDNRGRHRKPRIPALPEPACAPERCASSSVFSPVAALRQAISKSRSAAHALLVLNTSAPLADRSMVCASQLVRWRHGHNQPADELYIHRAYVMRYTACCGWPGLAKRLEPAAPSLLARFHLHHGTMHQRGARMRPSGRYQRIPSRRRVGPSRRQRPKGRQGRAASLGASCP